MPETEEQQVLQLPQPDITPDIARDVLRRFVVAEGQRIAFARRSRKAMHADIDAKREPQGHRPDFLAACADTVIEALLECGKTFEGTYSYDTILLGDYLDILATARARFVRAAGGEQE